EIGVVIASVALLIKRRLALIGALVLGGISIGYVALTWVHTAHVVHAAKETIEHTGKEYRELRTRGKMTTLDEALVKEVREWPGKTTRPPAPPAPAKAEHPAPHHHH